jgi:hypothetical protein
MVRYHSSMGEYWRNVLVQTWASTKGAFRLNQKTAVTALLAIFGFLITYAKAGFPDPITQGVIYLWYAVPFGIAGMLLFAWNFVQIQARMYVEVAKELAATKAQISTPDLSAWGLKSEFYLYEAACLFAETSPNRLIEPGSTADAWFGILQSELESNKIGRIAYDTDDAMNISRGKYRPTERTKIARGELEKVAAERKVTPSFLSGN